MLVFAAVLTVIVLVLVLVSRHNRAPGEDPAAPATPTAQVAEQDTVLAEAKHLAAQYDYDKAIAAVTGFTGWENVPELQQAKADFEAQKAQAVRYADPTTIPHIFFHTLIADTARAFDGDPEQGGYNQFMATIREFNAVLQSLYERDFVLVDIHDIAGPQQQADGSTKYVAGDIYLPAGKKPIVMSQDDVCYYEYMTDSDGDGKPDKGGDGFASRLLVRDGKLTCEYVDADGQTLYGSYDLVPLLDDFLAAHPDFSYRGARATIAVTGYQGAFGYRISSDYKAKLGDEAFAQSCQDAREVADARAEDLTKRKHLRMPKSYGGVFLPDVEPPHGDDVGHESDGLDDHARVRAREDIIREPERRVGQIEDARAAHIPRPERDGRHAHGDARQQAHRPSPREDGVDHVQRQKRPQPCAALRPLPVVKIKHDAARERQNIDRRGGHRTEQPVVHDPHQAGGGLRGEDDTAVIELHRDKHDQAAEQPQRLIEPETHMRTPFLPAGKRIVTQKREKNNPSRAFFSASRVVQALTAVPKTATLFLSH